MIKTNCQLDVSGKHFEVVELIKSKEEREELISKFSKLYGTRPFDNSGGIRFNSALGYYFFLTQVACPSLIIESGIWRGFSTWLIDTIFPQSTLICLDPILVMQHLMPSIEPVYRPKRAIYAAQDFSCFDFSGINASETCVIFDDHQNAPSRLMQAYNNHIPHVLLDDNGLNEEGHTTITDLLAVRHPVLSELFEIIEEYYVFPSITSETLKKCSVPALYEQTPKSLLNLDPNEFAYTWVTYIKLRTHH